MKPIDRAADDVEPGDLPGIPRPRETQALVGHTAAAEAFAAAIAAGRLHHAWLIGGPAGIGKATLAYRVARRLLAYPRGGGPAGLDVPADHPIHGQVAGLSHPNLVALRRHRAPGAKSLPTKITVPDVRRGLELFANTAADSGWRVCVLDSAEDMNVYAANALLKVLEEPPPRALFLILAHQPGRLLPTIRSRCRAMILRPLSGGEVGEAVRAL
ncbi:MAG: DNA polymerase III subunit delta', partial [Actinomycetospora chiangmaiensis]|nr:DNA polymerase III subunit delta' [Actinomycetospora chiangmaiensis]